MNDYQPREENPLIRDWQKVMEAFWQRAERLRTIDDPSLPPTEPLNEKARAHLNDYLTKNPPQP